MAAAVDLVEALAAEVTAAEEVPAEDLTEDAPAVDFTEDTLVAPAVDSLEDIPAAPAEDTPEEAPIWAAGIPDPGIISVAA